MPEEVLLLRAMLRLSSVISRPMRDGVADPEGLSVNELRVMMSIGGQGEIAGHELAELIAIQPMNVSRALAVLEGRGWVERIDDPANRRRKPYRLSDIGIEAYRAMTPEVLSVAEFLFAHLTKAEKSSFAKIVAKLNRRVDEWPSSEA